MIQQFYFYVFAKEKWKRSSQKLKCPLTYDGTKKLWYIH